MLKEETSPVSYKGKGCMTPNMIQKLKKNSILWSEACDQLIKLSFCWNIWKLCGAFLEFYDLIIRALPSTPITISIAQQIFSTINTFSSLDVFTDGFTVIEVESEFKISN